MPRKIDFGASHWLRGHATPRVSENRDAYSGESVASSRSSRTYRTCGSRKEKQPLRTHQGEDDYLDDEDLGPVEKMDTGGRANGSVLTCASVPVVLLA